MITGLTKEQFRHLPGAALRYPCDRCGNMDSQCCNLKRSISDYALVDGEITMRDAYTALYLCSRCEWQEACDYQSMEREQERQIEQLATNVAKWLQKVSQLPVQELAKKVGVSRQSYHKWLRGKAITDEHKVRMKELIAMYIQVKDEE